MRLKLLPLLAVLLPHHAHADEVTFTVVDLGDNVEVIAHNLTIKNTNVSQIRSRLEIPLSGNPFASRQTSQDATVMQVELDGFALSVKTRLDKPEVHELAKLAHAEQVGNDVHLTFPRHALLAPAQPAPAATKPEAPKAEAAKPVEAPKAVPATATATTPAPVAAAAVAPVAKVETPVEKKPEPQKLGTPIPPEKRDWSGTGFYMIAALGALGGAAYLMKKKKQAAATQTSTIDIVAQRTLGNKAKVVWLAAGQREMIVSVTGTQVRVLGQWPRGTTSLPVAAIDDPTAGVAMPRAHTLPRLPTATAHENPPERPSLSPSVAGILKLRAQTQNGISRTMTSPQIPVIGPSDDDDLAGHEPDLAWAKEILAATGRR